MKIRPDVCRSPEKNIRTPAAYKVGQLRKDKPPLSLCRQKRSGSYPPRKKVRYDSRKDGI